MSMSSVEQAWRLIAYSSAITVAGTLIIYVDVVWNALFSRKINILKSRHFMVASLACSAGVLLTTALHSLLANSVSYFRKDDFTKQQANQLLLAAVVSGFAICIVVNLLIHMVTSKSIVHCAHEHSGEADTTSHSHGHGHEHSHYTEHSHSHAPTHTNYHDHALPTETSALIDSRDRPVRQYISVENLKNTGEPPIHSSLIDKLQNNPVTGECRGFESIYHCAAEIVLSTHPSANGGDSDVPAVLLDDVEPCHDHTQDDAVHHHHVVPRVSELLSIGLQTAFAITVHKLPEGFMIFATERNDKQVGLNVFVALAIHNFFEGFTIACPLYLALENRFKAVIYASILSAGSQPLGALLAQYIFRGQLNKSNFAQFGFLIAGTAGFMIIIALQMLTTAVSYGGSPHTTLLWSILGIIIVLASNCL